MNPIGSLRALRVLGGACERRAIRMSLKAFVTASAILLLLGVALKSRNLRIALLTSPFFIGFQAWAFSFPLEK